MNREKLIVLNFGVPRSDAEWLDAIAKLSGFRTRAHLLRAIVRTLRDQDEAAA